MSHQKAKFVKDGQVFECENTESNANHLAKSGWVPFVEPIEQVKPRKVRPAQSVNDDDRPADH
jgi:hypothetical protein